MLRKRFRERCRERVALDGGSGAANTAMSTVQDWIPCTTEKMESGD